MLAIFLDIETTGLDPTRHKAIDIGIKIIDVTTGKLVAIYQSILKQPRDVWENKDPSSIEVNGYTWQELLTGKDPSVVTEEIIALFTKLKIARGSAVFICQNPAFDRGFFAHIVDVYTQERLLWPYHWLDLASMYWTQLTNRAKAGEVPFPVNITLSKNEIAKACGLPPEKTPHHAMNGVDHLIQCYQAVLGVSFDI